MVGLSGRTTPLGHAPRRESLSGTHTPTTNGTVANTTKVKVGTSQQLANLVARTLTLTARPPPPPPQLLVGRMARHARLLGPIVRLGLADLTCPRLLCCRAVVRIRPTSASDAAKAGRFNKIVVHPIQHTTLQIEAAPLANGPSTTSALAKAGPNSLKQTFTFDRVVGPDEGQEAVYEEARALVDSFMTGLNVTILAYGQTSSGKSYTMGTDRTSADDDLLGPERLGITPRAVAEIFDRIQVATKQSAGATTFQAKAGTPSLVHTRSTRQQHKG